MPEDTAPLAHYEYTITDAHGNRRGCDSLSELMVELIRRPGSSIHPEEFEGDSLILETVERLVELVQLGQPYRVISTTAGTTASMSTFGEALWASLSADCVVDPDALTVPELAVVKTVQAMQMAMRNEEALDREPMAVRQVYHAACASNQASKRFSRSGGELDYRSLVCAEMSLCTAVESALKRTDNDRPKPETCVSLTAAESSAMLLHLERYAADDGTEKRSDIASDLGRLVEDIIRHRLRG